MIRYKRLFESGGLVEGESVETLGVLKYLDVGKIRNRLPKLYSKIKKMDRPIKVRQHDWVDPKGSDSVHSLDFLSTSHISNVDNQMVSITLEKDKDLYIQSKRLISKLLNKETP